MSPQGFGPETKTQQGIIGTPASSTKCGALAAIGNRKKISIFVNMACREPSKSLLRIYEMLAKDQRHACKGSRVLKQFAKGNGIGVLPQSCL